MVWVILRPQKAPKPYVYNGLGDFETSKLQNLTSVLVWVMLRPQKSTKTYVYGRFDDFETSKISQTLRIQWLG